jgi:HEPN domain-containing protein
MSSLEAERLLRIARRDLRMAGRLLDPEVEEASWGWALQQTLEKTLKAWLRHLGVKPPRSHDIARLLVPLKQAGAGPLRACLSGWFDSLQQLN